MSTLTRAMMKVIKKNKQTVGMTKMWDDCKFLWEQACKRFPGEGLFILT